METNTKADGAGISVMDRAPFGWLMPKISYAVSTLEIGKMIPSKEEGLCSIREVIGTMECGWIASLTAKDV